MPNENYFEQFIAAVSIVLHLLHRPKAKALNLLPVVLVQLKPLTELTNKDVFEFYKKNRDSLGTVDMFLIHFVVETTANTKTVRNKIKSVYDSNTYKLKSASKKAEFLSKQFDMPISQIERKIMKDSPK